MSAIPPALVIDSLLALLVAQLCYVFFPYRHRAFLPILVLAAIGIALGQLWDVLGIPDLRFGSANLIPGLLFAVAFQPLASRPPFGGRR